MKRFRLCLMLALFCGPGIPALAQSGSGTAASQSPDTQPLVKPAPAKQDAAASAARTGYQGGESTIAVGLDPETLWRPRGAEVRFIFSLHARDPKNPPPTIISVAVTFAWSQMQQPANASQTPTPPPIAGLFAPLDSPLVRNIPTSTGIITYGATVPDLPSADVTPWARVQGQSPINYTGVYTVPVADMTITAFLSDGTTAKPVTIVLPVGITSLPAAFAVLGACLALSVVILWRWTPPFAPPAAGARESWMRTISRHGLAIISSPDGVASLSQFQIMLWTFVVFAASVYVMVLSGNLIGITDGALILLGIAGGTSVITRATRSDSVATGPQRWAQLLVRASENGPPEIDVTRVQMLIFTLVSAAFVTIKVAVTYEIPDIPANFLLLMGISNGVYIGGRQTTGQASDS